MFAGTYLKLDRQAFRALRNVYNEANSAARKLMQTPDESELDELIEANKESWKKLSDPGYGNEPRLYGTVGYRPSA